MIPDHQSWESNIGVGATEELSLRVSVASLAKVVFEHPQDGHTMLALERVATLRESEAGREVTVKAQPFGGAVRLRRVSALRELVGDFHFDSPRSRAERDFRVQIRPSDWEAVKDFCLGHLQDEDESVLEAGPGRELVEEFADTLHIGLTSSQYRLVRMGVVLEDAPAVTDFIHAAGSPTVRIYHVHQVLILDPSLVRAMLANSERYTDQALQALALHDARRGGRGRANAVLALPVELVW